MQEELRRCNYLGSMDSIYRFSKIAITNHPTDLNSIVSICSLDPTINVKVVPCLQLFLALNYVNKNDEEKYVSTDIGRGLLSLTIDKFTKTISEHTLAYLVDQNLLSSNSIVYNHVDAICRIKRSGFPFHTAVLRNLLIESGALCEKDPGIFDVQNNYEMLFEDKVKHQRYKMNLEQLLEMHKRQEQQGRLAEEFVVDYEKRRLLWSDNSKHVKQISDFDVTAGYDIVSYNYENSKNYDRFIEVKSYSYSQSFFWSSNEVKSATKLGDMYYIYLVNMELIQTPGYEPVIIQNPAEIIFNTDDWMIETSSYKITKV